MGIGVIAQSMLDEHFPNRPLGYFDHAAVGTVPVSVARAVSDVARALERGTRGSAAWHAHTDDALDLLSSDFGVPAQHLTVLENSSAALNIAARSIPLREGARVLTFDDDFPSPRMPWAGIRAARVTELAPGANRTETLLDAIDVDVSVVSVTHVHATTGETLDLARVHAACRAVGAMLFVDGAQAAGLIPGGAAHADVYVGASYKWLLAGFGAAVVATSSEFEATAVPVLRGYMNPSPSHRLEVGHTTLFMLAALQRSALVRHEIGVELIREYTAAATLEIAQAARALGFHPLRNERGAGIVSLAVADASALQQKLNASGITTAVRDGHLRLSPHLTTTRDDIDLLIKGLTEAAASASAEGAR